MCVAAARAAVLQAATIKQMAADVSAKIAAWWDAPAQLPHLPALAAALAAAAGGDPAAAAAAAANGQAQQQQQQPMPRKAVVLQAMVAGYMPLTVRDIEEWSAEGEVWAQANSDTTSSTVPLRACCQQLVLRLVLEDTPAAAPVLVTLLKGVTGLVSAGWGFGQQAAAGQQQQQQPGVPALPGPCVAGPGGVQYPAVLLLKEAVYDAAALAAYQLHEAIDYRSWLHSNLLPELLALQQPQQQAARQQPLPLMPRAAACVVGQWVSDLKPEDRQAAYAALTVALVQPQQQQHGQEPDVVLQLAVITALRFLVDDFGFESQGFVGVLPAVVGALTAMLKDSDELDTQTQVRECWCSGVCPWTTQTCHLHTTALAPLPPPCGLALAVATASKTPTAVPLCFAPAPALAQQVFGLMNLVIERLGEDITPHVQGLLPLLPQIWQSAHDQSLLRIQVGGGPCRAVLGSMHTVYVRCCLSVLQEPAYHRRRLVCMLRFHGCKLRTTERT
jgi:hypothetical protein